MLIHKPRTPLSMAVMVGVAIFMVMTAGVGGYQAVAGHAVGAFMLGIDPAPHHAGDSTGPVAGSALSMCAQSAADEEPSSLFTVHATSWRQSMSERSTHSPTGLVSICN